MKHICILITLALFASGTFAQFDGARTYWALPKNMNILSAHGITAKANASINNLSYITPSVTVDNKLWMLTYTRSQPVLGRTFFTTLIVPAGSITTNIDVSAQGPASTSKTLFQHGLGDIVWSNTINIIGAKGLMIKDFVRHENSTLVYLQGAMTIPTGQYNSDDLVNIGSNQFKFKLGMPIVQRIGPKVEGSRITVELFPSYTFISKNNDFQGQEIDQKGLFTLETHITKDITPKAFISLDYSYLNGGSSDFISKQSGTVVKQQAGQDVHLLGATVGFNINDRFNLFLTHNQSFSSGNKDVSLEGTVTKLTLSWSFHDFQEKFKKYLESN